MVVFKPGSRSKIAFIPGSVLPAFAPLDPDAFGFFAIFYPSLKPTRKVINNCRWGGHDECERQMKRSSYRPAIAASTDTVLRSQQRQNGKD
jgi:hypothetical protein